MKKLWRFLASPIFIINVPGWLNAAVLVFVLAVYIGFRAGVAAIFAYRELHQFPFLPADQAAGLRNQVRSLYELEVSTLLTPNDAEHLRNRILWTENFRNRVPNDLVPVTDMQEAKNYLILAYVERQREPQKAVEHIAVARGILSGLGWNDLPDETLMALVEQDARRNLAPK